MALQQVQHAAANWLDVKPLTLAYEALRDAPWHRMAESEVNRRLKLLKAEFDGVFTCPHALVAYSQACPAELGADPVWQEMARAYSEGYRALDEEVFGRVAADLYAHAVVRWAAQHDAGGFAFVYQETTLEGVWTSRPQWATDWHQAASGVVAGWVTGQPRWAITLQPGTLTERFIAGRDARGQKISPQDLPSGLTAAPLEVIGPRELPPFVREEAWAGGTLPRPETANPERYR